MNTNGSSSKYSAGVVLGAAALCGVAIAGIVTVIVMAFSSTTSAPAAHVVPSSSASASHGQSGHSSAAVESLQRELAQLNYYNGPINGVMNTQTSNAIDYLQRDAHLPQTGQLNAATEAALFNFLAHGNNQMGA